MLLVVLVGCVSFGAPKGPPHGTYAERIETFARLLGMQDRRDYDPLLTGRAAASPDPWLRRQVALAVGRLKDLEASPYLPVLVRDEEPTVRRAAAFAAGVSGDARLVRFLVPALRDVDPGVGANAADSLGKLGGDEATEALLAAAGGASTARAAAALALWRFDAVKLLDRLGKLAADAPRDVKRAAVYALARKPVAASSHVLSRALREDDAELVAVAERGLGVLGDSASATELTGLAYSQAPSVAIQALLALERIGAKSALPASAKTVALGRAGDHLPGVSVAALKLLGRFREDDTVVGALENAIAEEGWRGQTALVSLGASSPRRAGPLLQRAADSTSLEMRLGAADALAVIPTEQALPLAHRLMKDPKARVRAEVLSALQPEKLAADPTLLVGGLKDPDPAVREASLKAAAPMLDGSPASRPVESAWNAAYLAAFREREPDFTVGALDAAASLPSGGREHVEKKVDDPDAVVREKARRLLAEKWKVDRSTFRRIPVAVRYGLPDYRRIAKDVNEKKLSASVTTAARPRPEGVEVDKRYPIEIDLLFEEAPITVENIRQLAAKKYFDGTIIHRVVPDFVVQMGDPRGDGNGGPGYSIRDELNPSRYVRGAVGMALSGPDTGGSQWFITLAPQPHLDGGYTVFGNVTAFLEVADRIEQDDALVTVSITEERRDPPPGYVGPR